MVALLLGVAGVAMDFGFAELGSIRWFTEWTGGSDKTSTSDDRASLTTWPGFASFDPVRLDRIRVTTVEQGPGAGGGVLIGDHWYASDDVAIQRALHAAANSYADTPTGDWVERVANGTGIDRGAVETVSFDSEDSEAGATAVGAESASDAIRSVDPTREADHEAITEAVRRLVTELTETQDDGWSGDTNVIWDADYPSDPAFTMLPVIAMNRLGVRDPDVLSEDLEIVRGLAEAEVEGGGFENFEGSGPSDFATRMVSLGLQAFLKNRSRELTDEQRDYVAGLIDRGGEALERDQFAEQPWLMGLFADVAEGQLRSLGIEHVDDLYSLLTADPQTWSRPLHEFEAPMKALMIRILDSSGWGSLVVTMSMLREAAQGKEPLDSWAERRILETLQADDSWFYNTHTTVFNLLALHAIDPERYRPTPPGATPTPSTKIVDGAIEFLRKLRRRDENGVLRQSFFRGDVWSTAVSTSTLLFTEGDVSKADQIADYLVDARATDGRWNFASNTDIPDNDTSGLVLRAVAHLRVHTGDAELDSTIRDVTRILVEKQRFGGWNAWYDDPAFAIWSEQPDMVHASVYGSVDPEATGDVLHGLLAARYSGAFDGAENRAARDDLDEAIESAVSYLQESQADNGTWWTRWISGSLYVGGFVMPAARILGDSNEPWIADARDWLLEQQVADGWGESVAVDGRPHLAGKTDKPDIARTAFVLRALIATAPDDMSADPDLKEAIDRGVTFLARKVRDSEGRNHQFIYTGVPGASYYAAPNHTDNLVLEALAYYQAALTEGVDAATCRLVLGHSPNGLDTCVSGHVGRPAIPEER